MHRMFHIPMKSLISSLMLQKENDDNVAWARVTNPSNLMSLTYQKWAKRTMSIRSPAT
jgi:hypothetical protein